MASSDTFERATDLPAGEETQDSIFHHAESARCGMDSNKLFSKDMQTLKSFLDCAVYNEGIVSRLSRVSLTEVRSQAFGCGEHSTSCHLLS